MAIQLPKDIEDGLNELAGRLGKPAAQLAVDAIELMLLRDESMRRWPLPKVVGIVGERDSQTDDQDATRSSDSSRPWSNLIGMFSDGGVPATEFEEWMEVERRIDHLEQEMRGYSHGDDGKSVREGGGAASGDGGGEREAGR